MVKRQGKVLEHQKQQRLSQVLFYEDLYFHHLVGKC